MCFSVKISIVQWLRRQDCDSVGWAEGQGPAPTGDAPRRQHLLSGVVGGRRGEGLDRLRGGRLQDLPA